jgi:uncharacterized protein (TIGR00296 family)
MDPCISLAKQVVEKYVKEKKLIELPDELPKNILKERAGTFVTIEKEGKLRACIGTYLPTRPTIAEEIIRNAAAAANEDYRFGPIQPEELPLLFYKVYVLGEPEPVEGISSLNPERYGVIVKTTPFIYPNQEINVEFDGKNPCKTGLLLPELEKVDTPERQFALACEKGNIDPAKEKIFIYRFSIEKHQ